MQHVKMILILFGTLAALFGSRADAETAQVPTAQTAPVAAGPAPVAAPTTVAAPAPAKFVPAAPYRTFLTIQRYTLENNGDPGANISNVRLEMKFGPEVTLKMPGGDQHWPIGNGQVQEINQTFEIPWAFVKQDGFAFTLQMLRKGAKILPCQFEVRELSQFNRTYTCQTDVNWQVNNQVPENRINREGVQIRVFTDRNTPSREIPKDAVALK